MRAHSLFRTGHGAGLVAFGLVCAAALVGVYWVAVRTVRGRVLDGRSLRGAMLTEPWTPGVVERVLDVVSVTSILAAIGVILGIALLRLRRAVGVAAIVLLLGANLTTQLLKRVVLDRPYLGLVEPAAALANSLPSGHVTAAFSVVVALVVVLPPALRAAGATAGVAFTTGVGVATMVGGWHRPSDAIAACLVVGIWAALVLGGVAVGSGSPVEPRGTREARLLGVAAVAMLVPGGLVAGVLLLSGTSGRHPVVLLAAYAAGALLTGGAAAAVLARVLSLGPDVEVQAQAKRGAEDPG